MQRLCTLLAFALFATIARPQSTPLSNVKLSGANNQVVSGATFTVKSGATFTIEGGGTLSGTQPLDATLTAIAGTSTAANKLLYFDGVDDTATLDFPAFSQTLLPLSTRATWLAALMPSSPATGDLVTYESGAWIRKAVGTTGQIPTAQSDGTWAWAAPGGAPVNASYIVKTADSTLSSEFALGTLSTGLLQVTATTGDLSSVTTSAGVSGLISDETGSGALVFGTSPTLASATLATPTISGAMTLPDGVRQTFNPDGTNAGLNVGSQAGDPSAPSNGDLWYDSTANELTARINGANVALGAGGGGGAPTTATYITQTADATLSNEQALSSLSTGIMRVANSTGVITSLTDSAGLAANLSDETGSGGGFVRATDPTISGIAYTTTTMTANSASVSFPGALVLTAASSNPIAFSSQAGLSTSSSNRTYVSNANFLSTGGTRGHIFAQSDQAIQVGFGALHAGTGQDVLFEGAVAGGTLGSPSAAASGRRVALQLTARHDSAFVNTASVDLATTQSQTSANRGAKVEIKTVADNSSSVVTTLRVQAGAAAGDVQVLPTTASTTTTNGALTVAGGVGIAGQVTAGGAFKTTSTTASTSTTTGSGIFAGGVGVAGDLNVGGTSRFTTINATGLITVQMTDAEINLRGASGSKAYIKFTEDSVADRWSMGVLGGDSTFYLKQGNTLSGATLLAVTATGADISGTLKLNAYGAGTLTTDASGNVTATSDERLKDITGSFTRGLAELRGIQPIQYKWRASTGRDTVETYSGFSAQNVLTHLPEAVDMNLDGSYALQDRALLAAAVNAIKELHAQNVLLATLVKDLANGQADKARAQAVLDALNATDPADKAARAAAKTAYLEQRVATRKAAEAAAAARN